MIRHDGITIDTRRQCLEHRGFAIRLGPCRFKIAHALLLAGPKNVSEIFDLVYRDCEDGGPLTGKDVIDQQIYYLRTIMPCIGLEVRSDRFLGRVRYWVTPSSASRSEAA